MVGWTKLIVSDIKSQCLDTLKSREIYFFIFIIIANKKKSYMTDINYKNAKCICYDMWEFCKFMNVLFQVFGLLFYSVQLSSPAFFFFFIHVNCL